MTFGTQVSISLFPIIILLIVFFDNRKQSITSPVDRAFDRLVVSTFFCLATYLLSWLPEGRVFPGALVVNWLVNMVYMCICGFAGYIYEVYVCMRIYPEANPFRTRKMRLALCAPALIGAVFAVTSPITGAVFYFDEANIYHRGSLFFLPYAINFAYIAFSILQCARHRRVAENLEIADDCRMFPRAAFTTAIGVVVQALFYGAWLTLPMFSLSVFTIYVTIQNRRITVDALTGLNNRRELDRYLEMKRRHKEPWCLILMDVDRFKSINDTYGHVAGDEALCRVADILREHFLQGDSFISRYGGDEFCMVLPCDSEQRALSYASRLNDAVARSNARSRCPYALSLSAGCALCPRDFEGNVEEIIRAADQRMYAQKNARKAESAGAARKEARV